MSKKITILAIVLISIFFSINLVFAQATTTTINLQVPFGGLGSQMQIGSESIGQYIKAIIAFVSALVIIIAIIMIMYAGVQWIIAGGDSSKIGKAKDVIIKAITGLIIALFAVFILQLVNPQTTIFTPINPEAINTPPSSQENKPCTTSSMCGTGLFCAAASKVCTAKYPSTNTEAGLCVGAEISGNHDLACQSGDCQILHGIISGCNSGYCCGAGGSQTQGSTCTSQNCASGLYCQSKGAGQDTGTCVPKGGSGTACSKQALGGSDSSACESGCCCDAGCCDISNCEITPTGG